MTPNSKGTNGSIFSIYSTLLSHAVLYFPYIAHFYHILFYIFQMLFIALENNVLTSGLVKEHQVLHSSPPSINSNYYKPFKAPVLLVLYWKI